MKYYKIYSLELGTVQQNGKIYCVAPLMQIAFFLCVLVFVCTSCIGFHRKCKNAAYSLVVNFKKSTYTHYMFPHCQVLFFSTPQFTPQLASPFLSLLHLFPNFSGESHVGRWKKSTIHHKFGKYNINLVIFTYMHLLIEYLVLVNIISYKNIKIILPMVGTAIALLDRYCT